MKKLGPFVMLSLILGLIGGEVSAEALVRFATLTSISKAPPPLVAQKKGFFEKNGVKVEMKLFVEGRAAIEAMAAGEFDLGMFGDIPGISLLAAGYP